MLPTNYISTSSLSSQVCLDSFTGIQSGRSLSWCGRSMLSAASILRRTVSSVMYLESTKGNLMPETNHKDNQGGAHSV